MNEEFFEKLKFEAEVRAFDEKTVKVYCDSMQKFGAFYDGKSFDDLGVHEIKVYVHHLLKARKLAANSVNRHLSAIRFFYRWVLLKHDYMLQLPNVNVPENPRFLGSCRIGFQKNTYS